MRIFRSCVSFFRKRVRLVPLLATSVITLTIGLGRTAIAATPDSHWSRAIPIDSRIVASNQVTYAVACSNSTFCAAVNGNGDANLLRDGKWSSSVPLNAGGSLSTVSCPTRTRCVALADGGKAVLFNGHTWTGLGSVGPEASYSISCVGNAFCAAVGANGVAGKPSTVATFNGEKWSSRQVKTTGRTNDRLMSVSCASAIFCMAVNLDGHNLTFNGDSWKSSKKVGPKGLIAVSCASRSFCLAVTLAGIEAIYNGTTWSSSPIPQFENKFAYTVSCASTVECTVVGLTGAAISWSAGTWSKPVTVFPGGSVSGVNIACSSNQSCVAVDNRGESVTY